MPTTWNFTVQIAETRIRVVNEAGDEGDFEIDPGDTVVWQGDESVARWLVGFTEVGKEPFAGNKHFFSGVGTQSEDATARHAPADYHFWVFGERPGGSGAALFLDPKLIIRARSVSMTPASLQAYAETLEKTMAQASQLMEMTDAVRLESLALARELENRSASEG